MKVIDELFCTPIYAPNDYDEYDIDSGVMYDDEVTYHTEPPVGWIITNHSPWNERDADDDLYDVDIQVYNTGFGVDFKQIAYTLTAAPKLLSMVERMRSRLDSENGLVLEAEKLIAYAKGIGLE